LSGGGRGGGDRSAESSNADRTVFCFVLVLLFIKSLGQCQRLYRNAVVVDEARGRLFIAFLRSAASVSSNNEIEQRQISKIAKLLHIHTVYYLLHTSASL